MLAARVRGAPRAEGWGRPSLTSKNSVDRSAAWLSFLLALGPGGGTCFPAAWLPKRHIHLNTCFTTRAGILILSNKAERQSTGDQEYPIKAKTH